jgi:iron-sulfur cluster repair protein YtfE (RIC family)
MARPTEAFHEEHRQLLEHVEYIRVTARELPGLGAEERSARRRRILDFLQEVLLPHAGAEERFLYPKVAEILGDRRSTDTMSRDHVAIGERIEALGAAEVTDTATLQELLFGLYALIAVHFEKEEEVYLPLLDGEPEDELGALFERMAEASGHGAHH